MNTRRRGFTLVECSVVCTIVAVFATVAVPSYQGRELRMARLDAVAALTRVQAEQEKYRSFHGMYATDLSALQGVAPISAQGRYAITLERTAAEAYRATASAQGIQAKDRACPAVVLEVSLGFPNYGPTPACWNR